MPNRASRTAWGPIVQVAFEQFFPQSQRIIQDALAYRFLPASFKWYTSMGRSDTLRNWLFESVERRVPGIRGGILCRKRYIEDKLGEMSGHGIQTLVILGAGMDTLPYRMPKLSGFQVYEVDLPKTIEAKKAVLTRVFGKVPPHVRLVPVDFNRQELGCALQDAGYSQVIRSVFVWEGVTQYLSEAAVSKVFGFLQNTCQGSQMVFTYVLKDFIDGQQMYDLEMLYHLTRQRKEFWQFGIHPGEVSEFLRAYGWREMEQVGSEEYQERYLHPVGRIMPVMEVERCVYAERL